MPAAPETIRRKGYTWRLGHGQGGFGFQSGPYLHRTHARDLEPPPLANQSFNSQHVGGSIVGVREILVTQRATGGSTRQEIVLSGVQHKNRKLFSRAGALGGQKSEANRTNESESILRGLFPENG